MRSVSKILFGLGILAGVAACHHNRPATMNEPVAANAAADGGTAAQPGKDGGKNDQGAQAAKPSKEKRARKVSVKEVQVLEKEPTGCEFLSEINDESTRVNFLKGNASYHKKVLEGLKKKAAKLGGNAIFVTHKEMSDMRAYGEAKAFWCEARPIEKK